MTVWLARFFFRQAVRLVAKATRDGYNTETSWEDLKSLEDRAPWVWR